MVSKKLAVTRAFLAKMALTTSFASANDLSNLQPSGAMDLGFETSEQCILAAMSNSFPSGFSIETEPNAINATRRTPNADRTLSVGLNGLTVRRLSLDFSDEARTFGGEAFANSFDFETGGRVYQADTLYSEFYGGMVDVAGELKEFHVRLRNCSTPSPSS